MNLACEVGDKLEHLRQVKIQNECAARLSIWSKPIPVIEYIKTISSFVGASHILSVFEENESLKVFFDDRRHVDALIRSSIHVMGHHVRIDYVVPPGIKVILWDVDPVLSNFDIVNLLSTYGAIVSPVICPPISDDTELCHIEYGVRYVYMLLNRDIPNKIEFKYGDQHYVIKTMVEKERGLYMIPYIKSDDLSEYSDEIGPNDGDLSGSSGMCVNYARDPDTNARNPDTMAEIDRKHMASESNKLMQIASYRSLKISASGKRKVGRPRKTSIIKHKKIAATFRAVQHIKKTTSKQRFISTRMRKFKQKCASKPNVKSIKNIKIIPSTNNTCYKVTSQSIRLNSKEFVKNMCFTGECALNMQKFIMFLNEVKGNRTPLKLAKKYIGNNCDTKSLYILIEQLHVYNASHNNINLKTRIWRLVKSIKESMKNAPKQD